MALFGMEPVTLGPTRIWTGEVKNPLLERGFVRLGEGQILRVSEDASIGEGSERIPLPGCTVLPGLADAHLHMSLDPELRTPEEQEQVDDATLDRAMAARARAMVEAGITTARDLGGGRYREIALRDRIGRGELPGPRLLTVGRPLTSPGGHCHFWHGEVAGAAQIRAHVRAQVDAGADWIKVMATGGVFTRGTSPGAPQFTRGDLRVVVESARAACRDVAAHCHGTEGIRRALRAGVRTLEHCSFAGPRGFGSDPDPALVAEIAASASWVSPTVNLGWGRRGEKDGEPTDFFRRLSSMLRSMKAAGVRFVASTDAGIPGVRHHDLPRALPVFARYAELSNEEALRSATADAALALGLAAVTGRVAPGLSADLLVVEGDPLADLAALERVRMVFARGRRVPLA